MSEIQPTLPTPKKGERSLREARGARGGCQVLRMFITVFEICELVSPAEGLFIFKHDRWKAVLSKELIDQD